MAVFHLILLQLSERQSDRRLLLEHPEILIGLVLGHNPYSDFEGGHERSWFGRSWGVYGQDNGRIKSNTRVTLDGEFQLRHAYRLTKFAALFVFTDINNWEGVFLD